MEGRPDTTLPVIHNLEKVARYLDLNLLLYQEIREVSRYYPFAITPHYFNLIEKGNPLCPIRRQAIPSKEELIDKGVPDPLNEYNDAPTPAFIKRYAGRGVFLASSSCAMYCRFCNRKRFVGKKWDPRAYWDDTFQYIKRDSELREIIISGGDPLMLIPEELEYILFRLREMRNIKVIRVSTRVPVVFPEGVTRGHLKAIKRYSPLWIILHINHPKEMTEECIGVVQNMRKAGATLVSQTVLLRQVNDCPHIMLRLCESLIEHGVKPYYLFQLDEVKGAMHFKVRLERGIEIMNFLRKKASGLAIPQYVLDITGGHGKVPVEHINVPKKKKEIYVKGLTGKTGIYRNDGKKSICIKCGLCREGK